MQGGFLGGHYHPSDGRIYLLPRCASRVVRFDPATNTWESIGDNFPESELTKGCKWNACAVSSIDNCIYSFPCMLTKAFRVLKIDPSNGTAEEVGEDLRTLVPREVHGEYAYYWSVANADGIINP